MHSIYLQKSSDNHCIEQHKTQRKTQTYAHKPCAQTVKEKHWGTNDVRQQQNKDTKYLRCQQKLNEHPPPLDLLHFHLYHQNLQK